MIDIKEGDLLVVDDAEYPIKAVAEWDTSRMSARSFARMATKIASTKRAAISDGKRTAAVEHITGLRCTPLDPISPQQAETTLRTSELSAPYKARQTFIADGTGFLHLIVEEIRS